MSLDEIMPPNDEKLADRWVKYGISALPGLPIHHRAGYRRAGEVEWEWRSELHYRGALMTITVEPW